MVETCPYLEYRTSEGEMHFETARGYCTAVEEFVQPMRADICNDRYGLHHASDCEIYRAQTESESADDESAAESKTKNATESDGGQS